MKDNFHIGFVVGLLTALFMAVVISCTMTPLEAGASELGTQYNPMHVRIVDQLYHTRQTNPIAAPQGSKKWADV